MRLPVRGCDLHNHAWHREYTESVHSTERDVLEIVIRGDTMVATPLVEVVAHFEACILQRLHEAQCTRSNQCEGHDELASLEIRLYGKAVIHTGR